MKIIVKCQGQDNKTDIFAKRILELTRDHDSNLNSTLPNNMTFRKTFQNTKEKKKKRLFF